ncbi:YafY family protein [Saccharibacillus sp. CPCC 101409]|uniref:helix-turn-helix transcriptional regulator n=1 Tax=Saccharibacillus sp. CPCC 101409 TaxID=3058041 RepID=UPI002672AB89|nr:YafY family protein [Saccharibacillus sp. CPCC 101409]MDO3411250.1 YafY family protein [Saccharibacillus sp. CPCC 101409]
MTKAERLGVMQRFVYRKRRFTLRELMDEFGISRSTALRDVASLEEIGLPLYAEHGRGGGYRLLETASLPPVSFNDRELLALYFAMQALRSFSGEPFNVSLQAIDAKFLDILSPEQREEIERFRHRVAFVHGEQAEPGEYLEELLRSAVRGRTLRILYASPGRKSASRHIQPFAVYAARGSWYCRSFDLDKREYRVFRCDRIRSVEPSDAEPAAGWESLDLRSAHTLRQPSSEAVYFRCRAAEADEARLKRSLYPTMELVRERGSLYLTGSYEPQETGFMLDYLAGFGEALRILEPASLKEKLRDYYLRRIERL